MSRSAIRQGLFFGLAILAWSCGPQTKRPAESEWGKPDTEAKAVQVGSRNGEPQQAAMRLFLSEGSFGDPSAAVVDDKVYAVWATPRADAAGLAGGEDYSIDLYHYLEAEERWTSVKHIGLARIWGLPRQTLAFDEQSGHLIVRYQSEENQIMVHLDRNLAEVDRKSLTVDDGAAVMLTPQGQLASATCSDTGSRIQVTVGALSANVPGACQADPSLHDLGTRLLVLWAHEWPGATGSGRDLFASLVRKDTAEATPPVRITSSDFEEHAVNLMPGHSDKAVVIWNQFDGTPGGESVQRSRTLFMAQLDLAQGTVTEPSRVESVPGSSLAPQVVAFNDELHLAWVEQGSRESAVYVTRCVQPCTGVSAWVTPQRLGSTVSATPPQFMTSEKPHQLSLAWVSGDPQSARLNTMTFDAAGHQWSHSTDLPEVKASIESFWTVTRGASVLALWSQTNAQGSHIATALVPLLTK